MAYIADIPSDYTTDGDDFYGMVDLADWFPDLACNYTKLGLKFKDY